MIENTKALLKKFLPKKRILAIMSALMVQAAVLPNVVLIASASEIPDSEVAEFEKMGILEQAMVLDETTGKYVLDEVLLTEAGFSDTEIDGLRDAVEEVNSIYFESNPKLRSYDWVANKYGNKVWKLPTFVIAAVAYMAGNVSDNIINRLIDWCIDGVTEGYQKFCKKYASTNWATDAVCVGW